MKKCLRRVHGFTVVVGLLLGLLAPGVGRTAPVPNLTGTWNGKYTCKVLSDGVPIRFTVKSSVLKITHTDTALNADIDSAFFYAGVAEARTDDPRKGAATFVNCATTPTSNAYNDMASVIVNTKHIKTKPEHATLIGPDVFSTGGSPLQMGSCTYSYTRVDLADPGVGPCP